MALILLELGVKRINGMFVQTVVQNIDEKVLLCNENIKYRTISNQIRMVYVCC